MKSMFLCLVTVCSFERSVYFGGTYCLHLQGRDMLRLNARLSPTARCYKPEDRPLHSHRRKNLKTTKMLCHIRSKQELRSQRNSRC
jgi:hypothetical protein